MSINLCFNKFITRVLIKCCTFWGNIKSLINKNWYEQLTNSCTFIFQSLCTFATLQCISYYKHFVR